jgi:hypothetical protein
VRYGLRRASAIAHKADGDGRTLRDAALAEGVDAKEFDERVSWGNIAAQAAFATSSGRVAIVASWAQATGVRWRPS